MAHVDVIVIDSDEEDKQCSDEEMSEVTTEGLLARAVTSEEQSPPAGMGRRARLTTDCSSTDHEIMTKPGIVIDQGTASCTLTRPGKTRDTKPPPIGDDVSLPWIVRVMRAHATPSSECREVIVVDTDEDDEQCAEAAKRKSMWDERVATARRRLCLRPLADCSSPLSADEIDIEPRISAEPGTGPTTTHQLHPITVRATTVLVAAPATTASEADKQPTAPSDEAERDAWVDRVANERLLKEDGQGSIHLAAFFADSNHPTEVSRNGVYSMEMRPRRQPPPLPARATPTHSTRPQVLCGEYIPVAWPFSVGHLAENFNPANISFPYIGQLGKCLCTAPCRVNTCRNGQNGLYCTRDFCRFAGHCGNSLGLSPAVQLMRTRHSKAPVVVAVEAIDEGVVLGEYFGELSLEPRSKKKRKKNEGYRLHFKADPHWGSKQVCINAARFGSSMRFLDHACHDAATDFHQLSNGSHHTIVAATRREVAAGEVITAYYGDELWFDCSCYNCQKKENDGNGE